MREKVTVKRVIDGDTIELSDGRKVRYIGIDTPETVDPRQPVACFGREASNKNKALVEGKEVELEKDVSDTDPYGRLLRYVYIGEEMVNEALVRDGFAFSRSYPPDIKYQAQFQTHEADARSHNRGLWGSCVLDSPGTTSSSEYTTVSSSPATNGDKPQPPTTVTYGSCLIKGNISSSGEKIYHLPGCGTYEKTVIDEFRGERWFCTEEEAQNAGWRKAKNCP